MNTCRCPNDPNCGIDHVAIEQENDTLREALIACPKFRDQALAQEGCDLLTVATTPDELWRAMERTCVKYLDWLVARAEWPWVGQRRTETQVLDDECRDYRVGPYAARKVAA
jgi:hypothetical protein